MPRSTPIGQSILGHQPNRQFDHATGIVTPRLSQAAQVGIEIFFALRATMLREGDLQIHRTGRGVAQIIQRTRRHFVTIRGVATNRTRPLLVNT